MSYFQLGIGSTMVSNYIYLEVQVVIIYPCVNLKSFMILQTWSAPDEARPMVVQYYT